MWRPAPRVSAPTALLCALLLSPTAARAQEPASAPAQPTDEPPAAQAPAAQTSEPPDEPPAPEAPEAPDDEVDPAGGNTPRRDRTLPRLDVYFPEGDLDFRLSRLINKVFFEGQVKYNFIEGDISAFLRYRYYGFKRTTQFAVFDAIEFEELDDLDPSSDFSRVRGGLFLFQWPHSYYRRTFVLAELDRISSNNEDLRFENNRTNTFVRIGYQLGTPEDDRSNAIVGETRARRERLFTAGREVGPGDAGFTGALTYGFDVVLGDFHYFKAEFETLKRFEITPRTFLIGRLHGGTFLLKDLAEDREVDEDETGAPQIDRYRIPLSEFFRLHGRENLKGLTERMRGTDELHTTWEYFFPWFLGAERRLLGLEWQNLYWILYSGVGTIGFDRDVYTDLDSYIYDAGLGFESSFKLRKYTFFLSGLVAQALNADGGVEVHLSVKSYR